MSLELIHASVQKGLDGDGGFASVVVTRGTPSVLKAVLVEISSYDFDPARNVGADSVEWAHRIITVAGKTFTVVSRIAPCGADWSGRPNRIAHHIVVDASERAAAGPAWLLSNLRVLSEAPPPVEERAVGPALPRGSGGARPATAWIRAGFDAGWAGVVARTLLDHPGSICYVVLPRACECLPLVEDVLALVPEDRRWFITFSTRSQRAPSSVRCLLRFVREGATGLQKLLNEPGAKKIVVSVTHAPEACDAVEAARSGHTVTPTLQQQSRRIEPVMRKGSVSQTVAAPDSKVTRRAEASRTASASVPSLPTPHQQQSDSRVAEPVSKPFVAPDTDAGREPSSIWVWIGFIYSVVAIVIALLLLWAKQS